MAVFTSPLSDDSPLFLEPYDGISEYLLYKASFLVLMTHSSNPSFQDNIHREIDFDILYLCSSYLKKIKGTSSNKTSRAFVSFELKTKHIEQGKIIT